MISNVLTSASMKDLLNKHIYKSFADFPVPKIVRDALSDVEHRIAWKRLHSIYVGIEARDIMFLLIHNKLPTAERMFRIGVKNDPYCIYCQDEAVVGDVEHLFSNCVKTEAAWILVRTMLIDMSSSSAFMYSNFELLNLLPMAKENEGEMVWLVSNFVRYVWDTVQLGGDEANTEKVLKHLKRRFKEDRLRFMLPGLNRVFPD